MKRTYYNTILAFCINILLVYAVYVLCQVEFILENWSAYKDSFFNNPFGDIVSGSLLFDTSAILYTNALYALMMLFPLHYKETAIWQKIAKWVFVIVNSLSIILNLGDSVYFKYTGRRTTISVLQEFQNEDNLGKVFGTEILGHWYLFLFGILLIYGLYKLYYNPRANSSLITHNSSLGTHNSSLITHNSSLGTHNSSLITHHSSLGTHNSSLITHHSSLATHHSSLATHHSSLIRYYSIHTLAFLIYIPITICGMRGGMTTAVRPITISNANQYVSSPAEAAAILNTPFSIIRTSGKKAFVDPKYSQAEIDLTYTAVHTPDSTAVPNRKNVVVIIVESFCKQYVEEGYAPFIKSLQDKSLTFEYSFANGRKSIDGMPSILSSIPMFVEPFFLTPASMNDVSGIAGELDKIGYQTAFFHGAENGSMGFEAFAKATGFKKYYGRTEYDEDKRFDGDKDFDGTWAIWDEPFLQFYDAKMSEMKQPFMTAVFTASSHHPFNVPEKYKNVYREEGNNPLHKCIRYTDMALRKFFETASKQPWYKNTIFVLTCDHTNGFDQPEYGTDLGLYAATLLFYDPTATVIKPEHRRCIAQQIDIMPTVLSCVGYNKPYIAFGQDMTHTPDSATWAVNYNNGIYQFVMGDEFYQFDGKDKITGLYRFKEDPLLQDNLLTNHIGAYGLMQTHEMKLLKAVIQDYMRRMIDNRLVKK